MKKSATTTTTAVMLILVLGLNGCANIKNDETRTRTEGTLLGVGAGAVLGAGIAAIASGGDTTSMVKGAVIGAVAGGVAGNAYGSKVAARKAEYASNEAYFQDCAVELRGARSRISASNAKTQRMIAAQRQELEQLIALQKNSSPTRERFVALNRSAGSSYEVASDSLKHTNALIQEHEAALRGSAGGDSSSKTWRNELADLKEERAKLQVSINSLNSIKNRSGLMIAQAR